MENEKIHAFAMKWLQKYEDDQTTTAELENDFGEACFALGFEMDCGHSFCESYSIEAFRQAEALQTVLPDIDDPQFLGSAIFSKWRGITHWDESNLLIPEHRQWFLMAFHQLAQITCS